MRLKHGLHVERYFLLTGNFMINNKFQQKAHPRNDRYKYNTYGTISKVSYYVCLSACASSTSHMSIVR